jgi:hypothetical protein
VCIHFSSFPSYLFVQAITVSLFNKRCNNQLKGQIMRLLVTKRRFYSCYVLYKRKYFRQHYVFNDLNPYIDLKLIQITFRCTASLNEVFFFPRGHSRQTLSQHKGNIKCFCYSRTVGHVTDQGRVKVPSAKSRLKKKQESRRAFGGVARGTLWLS